MKCSAKYVSEPQLHSHCVVPNITKLDDQYQALELSPIVRSAPFIESIYHSEMALGLQRAGYEIERIGEVVDTPTIRALLNQRQTQNFPIGVPILRYYPPYFDDIAPIPNTSKQTPKEIQIPS